MPFVVDFQPLFSISKMNTKTICLDVQGCNILRIRVKMGLHILNGINI